MTVIVLGQANLNNWRLTIPPFLPSVFNTFEKFGVTPEGLFYALRQLDETTSSDDPSHHVKMAMLDWTPAGVAGFPPTAITLDVILGTFRVEVCISSVQTNSADFGLDDPSLPHIADRT